MKIVLIFILMGFSVFSCNSQSKLTEQIAADKICDCYNEQNKILNDKNLTPCFDRFINDEKNKCIIKQLYPDSSLEKAVIEFSRGTSLILIRNCDLFYSELAIMYSNFYPLDTSIVNKDSILVYDKLISQTYDSNDLKKFRHKRLAHLLMTRDYQRAQVDIDSLKNRNEVGAFLASAWSLYKQGRFNESLTDIEKAISFGTNPDIKMFKEIIIKNCK